MAVSVKTAPPTLLSHGKYETQLSKRLAKDTRCYVQYVIVPTEK